MSAIRPSEKLRQRLREARAVVALTGAGVSAESGLATFRGPDGIWEGRDPMSLATPQAFEQDPETVWHFYAWRRQQAARAEPNDGHRALVELERRYERFLLVTQNVDGLHERAGSLAVVRLHGSLWRLRCLAEQREFDDLRQELGPLPARCECGGMLRPGVVWFGEGLPGDALAQAERACRDADLVLVAGTSGLVYPAAGLPAIAASSGAYVVEINPERTPLTPTVDEHLAGPSGEILPRLVDSTSTGDAGEHP